MPDIQVSWIKRENSDGSWTFFVRWKDDTGKRRHERVFRTEPKCTKRRLKSPWAKRAADAAWKHQQKLDGFQHKTQREHYEKATITASKYIQWLAMDDGSGQPNAADGTIANQVRHINDFVEFWNALGSQSGNTLLWMPQMSQWHCAQWRDELLSRGLKAGTVNTMLASVSAWLTWCVQEGYKVFNPMRNVRRQKVTRERLPRLKLQKPEDVRALLDSFADDPLRYPALLLLAHTGMRQGEATKLTWSNYSGTIIHVPRAKTTKTKLHERWIPVTFMLQNALDSLKLRRREDQPYILLGAGGNPFTSQYNRWLKGHDIKPHALRAFFKTALETIGAPSYVVDDLLGHSPGKVRAAYTPASNPSLAKEWIGRFEQWFKEGE